MKVSDRLEILKLLNAIRRLDGRKHNKEAEAVWSCITSAYHDHPPSPPHFLKRISNIITATNPLNRPLYCQYCQSDDLNSNDNKVEV